MIQILLIMLLYDYKLFKLYINKTLESNKTSIKPVLFSANIMIMKLELDIAMESILHEYKLLSNYGSINKYHSNTLINKAYFLLNIFFCFAIVKYIIEK